MISIHGKYTGGKNVEMTHGPSGAIVHTTAPKDNNGDGNQFSPTDLVSGALGACMLTIMAIVAERENVDLKGTYFDIEKHMLQDPRRIGKLPVTFHLPKSLPEVTRKKLENAAKTCPVHKSLHPEIEQEIEFIYDVV